MLSLEVERVRSKIASIATNQLVMSSGDGLLADELLHEMRKLHSQPGPADIDETVMNFLNVYIAQRQRRLAEQFTLPIGYDFARFQAEGMKNLGPQLCVAMIQQMGQFNLGADLLIVGFSEEAARVALIQHPGTMRWLDSQEFYAIGSGSMHAVTALMLSGHASRWSREQALFSVFSAKRVAERAPGVGNNTDMQIVTRDGIKNVGDATFKVLERMYAAQSQQTPVGDYTELRGSIDAAQA